MPLVPLRRSEAEHLPTGRREVVMGTILVLEGPMAELLERGSCRLRILDLELEPGREAEIRGRERSSWIDVVDPDPAPLAESIHL